MLKKLILFFAVGALAFQATPSHAQQLIETYVALLSEADHFNSSGQRLTSAAAIIRQDRANYHRFGVRDPEDEDDALFADEQNRQALERMLERGHADPGVLSRIVNGTVLVRVNVYRSSSGPFVQVTVLNNPKTESNVHDQDDIQDYTGRFTTEALYTMCSANDPASREKCDLYIQGLLNGLNTGKSMQEKGMAVCLPPMTPEEARIRILGFMSGSTGGNPSNNKDGGDWMAFMGLASGNTCK
jgi:hypothetical protein